MRRSIFILTLITIILISCDRASDKKVLDFGRFEIKVPKTWEKVIRKNRDRLNGQIVIDETDTLNFDLGWYADDLMERPDYMTEGDKIFFLNNKLTKDTLIYDYIGTTDSIDVNDFYNDSVSWTISDARKTKLVRPKRTGIGTTGIFIDSLETLGHEKQKFQINGRNLKPENEQLLLEAIKTLRFKSK